MAKMPTLAALVHRHAMGLPFVYPDHDLSYCGNFKNVKTSEGEVRLMDFGHRAYQNYDPRAKIINQMADQVFEVAAATRCSTSPSRMSAS